MAKHVSTRLLRPAQATTSQKPTAASGKLLPIRSDPGPLPRSTILYRKPIHPGYPLPASSNAEGLPRHPARPTHLPLQQHLHEPSRLQPNPAHEQRRRALPTPPSSARKRNPPTCAKISGRPLRSPFSPPRTRGSTPSASCGNSGDCTRPNGQWTRCGIQTSRGICCRRRNGARF